MTQDVNKIARSFGSTITKAGMKMLQSAFSLTPEVLTKNQLYFLWARYKIAPITFDNTCYVINWNDWLSIMEYDWTKEKEYITDRYDCENFSFSFASRMSELYNINSVLVAVGQKCNGTKCEQHAWDIIIAKVGQELKLIAYEPQNGNYKEHEPILFMGGETYKDISHLFLF